MVVWWVLKSGETKLVLIIGKDTKEQLPMMSNTQSKYVMGYYSFAMRDFEMQLSLKQ